MLTARFSVIVLSVLFWSASISTLGRTPMNISAGSSYPLESFSGFSAGGAGFSPRVFSWSFMSRVLISYPTAAAGSQVRSMLFPVAELATTYTL